MLKTTRAVNNTASTNRLLKLWMVRYAPDLSLLAQDKTRFPAAELVIAASPGGRTKTTATVRRLLQISCEMAGLQTNSLYSYLPNIIDLAEVRRIAQSINQVYEQTLVIYEQQQSPSQFLQFIDSSYELFSKLAMPFFILPAITQLSEELEPLLLQLQADHIGAQDSRMIGFLTTQFHFSTREILKHLSPYERVLLSPYLKFIEEQICIPWHRVCAAAANYLSSSPTFALVEYLLPLCHEIAETVYHQAAQQFSYSSRWGNLNNPEVAHSTIRDLTMIQGYLLLSMLEGNMLAIEQELLPLCLMVFPSIDVPWDFVEQTLSLLVNAIRQRLNVSQQELSATFTQSLQALFAAARPIYSTL